ncbi:protein-glutamate methylesterase/protein-glutamine glutaminase [Ovoidimarina sediminis]|uniref:protein-glutamate methylesterase/protein-glutamine glutaminase n=1 Tax=Ovoidimarina sediminis TaxID=3079856 RepID=UPI0029106E8F|nr:chemotaxis response regulator protein-glutamate methylesterase [Rhodophyticola sp. MJ-SS7]MDU8945141.1 chemotaxis response regulator protein-glutamate methylesterase [Rhodophyticola sp. MJ-SS7]
MTVMTQPPRTVLLVDDSRTIRALLRATIEADPRLTVVGEAADPYEAREKIKALSPDVITLDVEMPRMNGLEFLERLMRLRPMPVVMVSTRTKEKSADAIRAMSIGAIDCVDVARVQADPILRSRLVETIYCAAGARVVARGQEAGVTDGTASGSVQLPDAPFRWNGRTVLIGSSTGGVDAIERVLSPLPADGPPVFIAQHMPEAFLRSLAQRLNSRMAPEVRIAEGGETPRQGEVLFAPGGTHHLEITGRSVPRTRLVPDDGEALYVPSVDRLFGSATQMASNVLAVILTGMGRDGTEGMLALKASGAVTLAQSGETCVVDGMPRAARDSGAVDRIVPLDRIGRTILELTSARARSSTGREGQ